MKTMLMTLFGLLLQAYAFGEPTLAPKAALCVACHGENGISPNRIWPNLAGQHATYLFKQLQNVKVGTRQAPLMASIIASLNEDDMQELAQFYAKQKPFPGTTPKQYVRLGERIYRGGNSATGVPACIACHGPQGLGNAQAGFPRLSGQYSDYTLKQLRAFKQGVRTNDLNRIMQDIAKRLSTEEMLAVAHYVEGLH